MSRIDAILLEDARLALIRGDVRRAAESLRHCLARHADGAAFQRLPALRELLLRLPEDERPTLPERNAPVAGRQTRGYGDTEDDAARQEAAIVRFLSSHRRRPNQPPPLFYGLVARDGPPLPGRRSDS